MNNAEAKKELDKLGAEYRADWSDGLQGACKRGHRKLAEWLIDVKGAVYF